MNPWDTLVAAGRITADAPLGVLTTYKLGGQASWGAEVDSVDDFKAVVLEANERRLEILMLGRGSNIVVADTGWDGLVIRLGGSFRDLELAAADSGTVSAGASVSLPVLARATVRAGWGGLEFYVGIPGSVGGAVTMNAGFGGGETAEVVGSASVMDLCTGEITNRSNDELRFGYRQSSVGEFDAVLSATFRVTAADADASRARMREVTHWRKEHQPGGTFNAGSAFKNPLGDFAGRIIDDLGLKGMRRGGVAVSERHGNFFVADPGAAAQDVYDLVHSVRRTVFDATGVLLEPEIRFRGAFRPAPEEIA